MKNIELRLDEFELSKIKEIKKFFDGDIYIFGSRLDLKKRGGDIDLYLIPSTPLTPRKKIC